MWFIYRILCLILGFYFGGLVLQNQGFRLMETETQILPIWAIIFPTLVGVIVAKRGTIGRMMDFSMMWMVFGILIQTCIWMFYRTDANMQIAIAVTPVFGWYFATHGKRVFDLSPSQLEAMKKRIVH